MPSPSLQDTAVEDRLAQLEAITERRNALLREMYHLMKRRQNVGFVLKLNEADEEDLPKFLDRLDIRKNPDTPTFLDNEMAEFDSPRRPTSYDVKTRSRSSAKSTAPIVKSPAPDPAAERRASLRRDVRKPDSRPKSRVVVDIEDDKSLDSPSTSRRFPTRAGDEVESDDVLAMEPPSSQPSRHPSSSLPPHHYPEDDDDDDRDELDLISPSPRSATSYELRTRSSTQARSRSHSTVIDISDSPSPIEVVDSDPPAGDDVATAPPEQEDVIDVDEIPVENKILIVDQTGSPVPEEVQVEDRSPQPVSVSISPEHKPEVVEHLSPEPKSTDLPEDVDMDVEDDRETVGAENLESQDEQCKPQEIPQPASDDAVPSEVPPQAIGSTTILERLQQHTNVVRTSTANISMQFDGLASRVTSPPKPLPLLAISPAQTVRSISIPAPSPPATVVSSYDFNVDTESTSPQRSISPTDSRYHFRPQYSLPPLKSLPIEFQRRSKVAKQQRKKDKEREKNGLLDRSDVKKEDCVPMGWNRWAATLRANPVWNRAARASKCLNTRDWTVAVAELKLVRTFERMETLKKGQWSFRQPKKQRGVGGLTKTHWDYLLDEMKWMRTDFREERKWKIVLAYNLARAVLEWHQAGSLAERLRRGICVLWKPPQTNESDENLGESAGDPMNVDSMDQMQDTDSLAVVDYGSDDDEDDDDPEKDQDVIDLLDATFVAQEGLDQGTQITVESESMEPKKEELEDSSALQMFAPIEDQAIQNIEEATQDSAMEVDDNVKLEESLPSDSVSLKPTSTDPILAADPQSVVGDPEPPTAPVKPANRTKVYAPLREHIAYTEELKLFLDLDDLILPQASLAEHSSLEALHPPIDLSVIFSDLPIYGLLDVAPPFTPSLTADGRKKSEKKSERDDPNKRAEDTTYTKVTPVGQFMHCKPTLLGPLQPAKHWRDGQWRNLDESPVASEADSIIIRAPDDIAGGVSLFYRGHHRQHLDEQRHLDLFDGTKSATPSTHTSPISANQPRRRAEHIWTERDDALLKATVERYPNNWALICEAFNSSRLTIPTDKRLPGDCLDRWLLLRETEKPLASTPTPMITRGLKRPANTSVIGINTSGSLSSINGFESKKRRRHYLMYETIRKAARKRELEKKSSLSQRKPSAIHDTHHQYNKMPKLTPQELSRIKAERDQKEDQEMMLVKRRQEEFARQMREAHRMQVPQNLQQQAQILQQQQQQPQPQPQAHQLPQQQANGVPRPPGLGIPAAQTVRNISQQQRIPTPLSAANARLSPQQIIHAQTQAAVQARAIAVAQAAQAQVPATNLNGVVAHMSPPYASRAATSSPALSSPPRPASSPLNPVNTPRPPSAQPLVPPPVSQVTATSIPRPPSNLANLGHFFPSVQGTQFTPEQMEQAIRFQSMLQRMPPGNQTGTFQSQS